MPPGFAQTPSSAAAGAGGGTEDKRKAARTKIKRFMKDLGSVNLLSH